MKNILQRKIRKRILFSLIILATILCTSPLAVAQQAAMADMKTFYFATIQEPTALDPATIYDGSDRATRLVYEGLVSFKGNTFEVEPNLATSWDISPDGTTYTFHLRQGVTFHDGTPFDATAVKFSLTRMLRLGKGLAWAFKMVLGKWNQTNINVIDDYTISITLKQPYPAFLGMMASRYAAPMISPSVMNHDVSGDLGHQWATQNEIGTGPYMLEKWTQSVDLSFVKYPNYWKGWEGKHADRVVMKIVPDPGTQRQMLQQAEIDSALQVSIDDVSAMKNNTDIKIAESKNSLFEWYVLMNTKKGLLQDIRLRKALSYAFDYDGIVQNVFMGYAARAKGPMPQAMPGFNPNVFSYDRDIAKARQLMADAGYANGGFTLSVTYQAGSANNEKILGVLTGNLGELGIKVQPVPLTWSALMDNLVSQTTAPDLCIANWWPDYPDPDSFITGMSDYYFWGGRASPSDVLYYNPTVAGLLSNATFQADVTARNAMYGRAQQLMVDDVPAIWVLEIQIPIPFRTWVQGYTYNAMYELTYTVYDMYKEMPAAATSSTTGAMASAPFQWEYAAGLVLLVIVVAAIVAYRKTQSKPKK